MNLPWNETLRQDSAYYIVGVGMESARRGTPENKSYFLHQVSKLYAHFPIFLPTTPSECAKTEWVPFFKLRAAPKDQQNPSWAGIFSLCHVSHSLAAPWGSQFQGDDLSDEHLSIMLNSDDPRMDEKWIPVSVALLRSTVSLSYIPIPNFHFWNGSMRSFVDPLSREQP